MQLLYCWLLLCLLVELQSFTLKSVSYRALCQKDSLSRNCNLLSSKGRTFEEEFADGDDDIEEEDMPSPNPVRLLIDTVFQKLFFFGLEDDPAPDLEKTGGLKYQRIIASKEFKDYKKNNLGNLFLTTDELVAQFISSRNYLKSSGKIKAKKKENVKQDDSSSVTEIIPRNPALIEKRIAFLDKEINLLEISLAALEDEENDGGTNNERLSLQQKKRSLEDELRSLKIHLITIREEEAELMNR